MQNAVGESENENENQQFRTAARYFTPQTADLVEKDPFHVRGGEAKPPSPKNYTSPDEKSYDDALGPLQGFERTQGTFQSDWIAVRRLACPTQSDIIRNFYLEYGV